MEGKWLAWILGGFFVFIILMMYGGGLDDNAKRKCRMELAKADKPVEVIQAACK